MHCPESTSRPRIPRVVEKIEITENKLATRRHFESCLARGISPIGIRKNLYCLARFSSLLGKPFNSATTNDIERVMAYIENSSYANNTKNLFRATIKQFYGRQDPRVSWIKVRGREITPKNPQELITKEEMEQITSRIKSRRKKALLLFLYDSAVRPSEFLAISRDNVIPDESGIFVSIPRVKTKPRTIYLIESSKFINDVPFGEYTYSGMKNIFDRVKFHKRFYPYILRHSRLTELAKQGWNEAMLCEFAGWVQGSPMPQVYIHLTQHDLKKRMMESWKSNLRRPAVIPEYVDHYPEQCQYPYQQHYKRKPEPQQSYRVEYS